MSTAVPTPAMPEGSPDVPGDCSATNEPADWTCYSAGEYTTDRVMKCAEDSTTQPELLSLLAESCNLEIRMAVADNQSTPLETLLTLAQDESDDLRYQLAESHNIHYSVLKLLSRDPNPFVVARAQRTLARLAGGAVIVLRAKRASRMLIAAAAKLR